MAATSVRTAATWSRASNSATRARNCSASASAGEGVRGGRPNGFGPSAASAACSASTRTWSNRCSEMFKRWHASLTRQVPARVSNTTRSRSLAAASPDSWSTNSGPDG